MSEYKHLGNLSATPPWHTREMDCHDCKVSWGGCWDNFQCPECGEGEIPKPHDGLELFPIPKGDTDE
jgi:hypothetical protein